MTLGRLGVTGFYVDARVDGTWSYLGLLTNAEPCRGWVFGVGKKSTVPEGMRVGARWLFDHLISAHPERVVAQAEVEVEDQPAPSRRDRPGLPIPK